MFSDKGCIFIRSLRRKHIYCWSHNSKTKKWVKLICYKVAHILGSSAGYREKQCHHIIIACWIHACP